MTTVPTTPTTADRSPSIPTVYGYPRQGRDRQLKRALERYWRADATTEELLDAVHSIRQERLTTLVDAGIAEIPVGDFSLYDHVLDTICLLGAVPDRYRTAFPDDDTDRARLDRYFAMARGTAGLEPLEMTKWFDTNYHYLVPELTKDTAFGLVPDPLLAEIADAQRHGRPVRPVVVGPFTFVKLAKTDAVDGFDPLTLLDRLLPVYQELLRRLHTVGVDWVQLDEPAAVTDLTAEELAHLHTTYRALTAVADRPRILVGTYFGHLGDAAPVLVDAGIDGLGVDLTPRGIDNLSLLSGLPGVAGLRLVAGVVDGRNVWVSDLTSALDTLTVAATLTDRVDVAASCSLLHVPHDATRETQLDPEVLGWLAFADQKLDEIVTLTHGLTHGQDAIANQLSENQSRLQSRRSSPVVRNEGVREQLAGITAGHLQRRSTYASRSGIQHKRLGLPVLPTTTIGSFPQTTEVRQARAGYRAGRVTAEAYEAAMNAEIDRVVEAQTDLGVDVLVHGEPERNDMVQYFAEQLTGVFTTMHGWVQSYGSRYVRPPIIAGDITRPTPMTVSWSSYAQHRTDQPVKGMLTGPVTMLAWSFVRDDQPRADTARQMAWALREEVLDLEHAGLAVIQVDEPALRETLPLRHADRAGYLDWSVDAFRLTTAGVDDATQIHTHMCYAEFGDIMPAIQALDADVISLEAARSRMEIVADLAADHYPNEVGPGVWDIHSPRVPTVDEITDHLRAAMEHLPAERIWVNPDCGLKTRGWDEVTASLTNLVAATKIVRDELARVDNQTGVSHRP